MDNWLSTILLSGPRTRDANASHAGEGAAHSYADALDMLPVTAFTAAADGAIDYISRGWTQITGYSTAEALGFGYLCAIDFEDAERMRGFWSGTSTAEEFCLRLRDGSRRWVLVQISPVSDPEDWQITAWFGTVTDIDAYKSVTEQLRQSESMYRAFAGALPGVTWAASPAGDLTFVGDRWLEIHAPSRDLALGDAWLDVVYPGDRERVIATWTHCLTTGDPYTIEFRVRVVDGSYHWFLVQALPVRDDADRIVRWVGVNIDIDDRFTAQEARQRLEDGLRLLARAGAAAVDSLDYQQTLRNIARAFTDGYASYCLIDVMSREGEWERTVEHRDPALIPTLMRLSAPRGDHPIARAIERGESSYTTVDDSWKQQLAPDRRDAVAKLGSRSVMTAPIVTPSGEVLGAVTCALDEQSPRGPFGPDDLTFVEEVGRRAGSALANVRLYERERRIALEFQAASLPARLPEVAGMRLDAAYRPASREAKIGGDWYDAFLLDDGRLAITVGDVLGHGLQAAVLMTKLRLAMQSAAMVNVSPQLMLRVADSALNVADAEAYATAAAAVYDPATRTLTIASAGHPNPLLRSADGRVEELAAAGLMLGLRGGAPEERTVTLAAGSALMFYTDGLIEYERDLDAGLTRVATAFADPELMAAHRPADALVSAVLGENDARDDVAVLIAQLS